MDEPYGTIIKTVLNGVVYAVLGVFSFIFKKQWSDLNHVKQEVYDLKISHAVSKSQINDLREDIKELKKDIKDAEYNILQDIKSLQNDIKTHRN